jgi:hypothetical protein
MNEVVPGEFPGFQQAMPGVFSTIPGAHGGYYVRFMKSTIAPAKPQ